MAYYERRFLERKVFTQYDVQVLNKLESDLDELITTHFPNGAFLRLCGRSPKDAEPLDVEKLKASYKKNLEQLIEEGAAHDANTKLIAISRVNWMCVTTGKEAMSLLLTSERVFTDLHDWIKYGEPEQIVLREFDPNLSMDYEFRAFINNNKVNALSQYDHYSIFPHVEREKDKIQKTILEQWKLVHPHVGQPSYCMDFVYDPKADVATVIEISPFLPCTGAALFHWTETKTQLEDGPFEFRLNQKSHPQLEQIVESNWEDRWSQHFPKYFELYEFAYPVSQAWLRGWYDYFLSFIWKGPNSDQLLFVYGTLKRNFHWNQKFLYEAEFVGVATTMECYPLVFGDCNVPYMLREKGTGKQVKGEVWRVSADSLLGMDDYEGVNKGYYSREFITVSCNDTSMETNVYFKLEHSGELLQRPMHEEYSLEYHLAHYQPIRHIQVKQKAYLGVQDIHHQT